MFTLSVKKIALGLSLAAVMFAGSAAMAGDKATPQNPSPNRSATARYGEMDSTQLLDQLGRDRPVQTPYHR